MYLGDDPLGDRVRQLHDGSKDATVFISVDTMVSFIQMTRVFATTLGTPEVTTGTNGSMEGSWRHGRHALTYASLGHHEWSYTTLLDDKVVQTRPSARADQMMDAIEAYEAATRNVSITEAGTS